MRGLMMNMPLQISSLIRHADRYHGDTEIVSRLVEGGIHRYNYRDAHRRARQLANALGRLGVRMTDRIGTLAWNGFRHFEIYYAVLGHRRRVPHHQSAPVPGADRLHHQPRGRPVRVLVDLTFVPLVEKLAEHCKHVQGWVLMTDKRAHAADQARQRAVLRGSGQRPLRRLTTGPVRREHGLLALLHLGHDGQPQGRALLPPLDVAARLRGLPARCVELVGPRRGDAGGAHVPRQRLGPALLLRVGGGKLVFPGAGWTAPACSSCSKRKR